MQIGTRSLLFGVHCWFLHPWFVLAAWWKLYGFPSDLRLWVAFVIHDWGYWGKPNMDGPEGQRHPEWAGRVMARLFGEEWGAFTRLHSRYYARLEGREPSRLCAADKLATALVPFWIYLPLARASGELSEYLHHSENALFYVGKDPKEWLSKLQAHWRSVACEQAHGAREDWGIMTSVPIEEDAHG